MDKSVFGTSVFGTPLDEDETLNSTAVDASQFQLGGVNPMLSPTDPTGYASPQQLPVLGTEQQPQAPQAPQAVEEPVAPQVTKASSSGGTWGNMGSGGWSGKDDLGSPTRSALESAANTQEGTLPNILGRFGLGSLGAIKKVLEAGGEASLATGEFLTGQDIAKGGMFDNPVTQSGADVAANTVMAPPVLGAPDSIVAPTQDSIANLPQGEVGSPQRNYYDAVQKGEVTQEKLDQANALAKSMGTTFDPATGYSRDPFEASQKQTQAPTAQGLTTVSGIPLSQFLSGAAIPEQGLAKEQPLAGRGVTLTPEQFDQASAKGVDRLDEQPDFNTAISDRERRGADNISQADYNDMAKGMLPGASPSERGRALKIANELGVNPATGQPLAEPKTPQEIRAAEIAAKSAELQLERQKQIIEQGRKPDATDYEKTSAARQEAVQNGTITQAQADDANKRDLLGNPPAGYDTWLQYESVTGIDVDGDGQVADGGISPAVQSKIDAVMKANPGASREDVIAQLKSEGKL